MYVGLLIRDWLIMAYNCAHSAALRLLNMMLLPVLMRDSPVGGERMEMSMAVDLRRGTRGVSSTATRGARPSGCMISSPSVTKGFECIAEISKTSIFPGVTTMLHSAGCKLSHLPASDQAKMDATALVAWPLPCGTVR
jgi:hypothetical protein